MKILSGKNQAKFLQEGGTMPAEGAPMEGGAPAGAPAQGGAEEQLAQVAQQLLQSLLQQIQDPQAVAMILQMALEMLSKAAQPAPGEAPQEASFMRNGGSLVMKRGGCAKKACKKQCGGGKTAKKC